MARKKAAVGNPSDRKLSVSEQVASVVTATRFGYASWVDKLPEPLRSEFEQARADWDHAKIRQAAYARAIIEVARQRGVETLPTYDTVCRWLRNRKA